MADLQSLPAHAELPLPVALQDETYSARFQAHVDAGVLCDCGSTVGGYDGTNPFLAGRGVCACFRARARRVPADANR